MKSKKLISSMLLIFVSGGIIGFVGGFGTGRNNARQFMNEVKNYAKDGALSENHLMKRFQGELDLTPEQMNTLKPAFDKCLSGQRALSRKIRPGRKKLTETLLTKIKEVLTEPQLKKFASLEKKRKEQASSKISQKKERSSSKKRGKEPRKKSRSSDNTTRTHTKDSSVQ
jgi:hypothetical protein